MSTHNIETVCFLMSTHNLCFHGEIRNMWIPSLIRSYDMGVKASCKRRKIKNFFFSFFFFFGEALLKVLTTYVFILSGAVRSYTQRTS